MSGLHSLRESDGICSEQSGLGVGLICGSKQWVVPLVGIDQISRDVYACACSFLGIRLREF